MMYDSSAVRVSIASSPTKYYPHSTPSTAARSLAPAAKAGGAGAWAELLERADAGRFHQAGVNRAGDGGKAPVTGAESQAAWPWGAGRQVDWRPVAAAPTAQSPAAPNTGHAAPAAVTTTTLPDEAPAPLSPDPTPDGRRAAAVPAAQEQRLSEFERRRDAALLALASRLEKAQAELRASRASEAERAAALAAAEARLAQAAAVAEVRRRSGGKGWVGLP
jgi:hypothetical protein